MSRNNKMMQCGHKYEMTANVSLNVKDFKFDVLNKSIEEAKDEAKQYLLECLTDIFEESLDVEITNAEKQLFIEGDLYTNDGYVDCFICSGMNPAEEFLTYEERGHLWGIGFPTRTPEEQKQIDNLYYTKYDGFKEAMDQYHKFFDDVRDGKYV